MTIETTTIGGLPDATTPLTGNERVPMDQAGATKDARAVRMSPSWSMRPAPSREDLTTFAACEAGLGRADRKRVA